MRLQIKVLKAALAIACLAVAACGSNGSVDLPSTADATIAAVSKSAAPATASPNNTTIPSATQIIDSGGNVWTVSAGIIYENGALAGYSNQVALLVYDNNIIYQENSAGGWWSWNGDSWISSSGPPSVSGACGTTNGMAVKTAPVANLCNTGTASTVSGTGPWKWSCGGSNGGVSAFCSASLVTPAVVTSPNGTTIPSATQVIDNSGNVWIVSGGTIYENGALAGYSNEVALLLYDNNIIYQENAAGGWWSWNGSSWVASSDPRSVPVSGACGTTNGMAVKTTPVANLCNTGTTSTVSGTGPWNWSCGGSNGGASAFCSASLVTPAVVTSPNGTTIPSATQVIDNSGNVWSVSGGTIYENGALAGYSSEVSRLLYDNNIIYQENAADDWWSWNGSTWVSSSDPLSVSVSGTPTISGSPTTSIAVGNAYSFVPVAAGPSRTTLTFSIQNLPAWAQFNSTTGVLSGTPGVANVGTYSNILISVSDGTLGISLPAFAITVVQAPPAGVQLSASSYAVAQNGGSLSVTVNRTGGSSGAISVAYATTDGTAVAGTDYTAGSGTLQWASGDASAKSFSVAISNATPFSGSRSFTVTLSAPSGGSTLSSPSSATVAVSGDGSNSGGGGGAGGGSGGPGAPANFQLTHQGTSDAVLSWSAAAAGANPIDHYKIYRNGVAYDTTSSTSYTDANAPNITTPGYGPQPFVPATVYKYTVSAVDTQGNEGPQQQQCTAWVYHNGTDYWTMSSNSYGSGFTYNPADNSGAPQYGAPYDMAVTFASAGSNWEPYSGQPFLHNMNPTWWAMELGMFNYMTIDMKPTVAGTTLKVNLISRITTGDNFNSAVVTIGGPDERYGPQAQVGVWTTYKIPFLNPSGDSTDLYSAQMGFGQYYGYISGNTLTVTQTVAGGINVQGSSFLTGSGIAVGNASATGTYVGQTSNTNGGLGSYPIVPAQSLGSAQAPVLINAQRTNLYKLSFFDNSGVANNTVYLDNIGFTVQ